MLDRKKRALLLQRVFWSEPGLQLVKWAGAFGRRWTGVVLNYSTAAEVNGEHWLTTLLGPAPMLVDAGFHRGEFAHWVLRERPEARVLGFEPAASIRELYRSQHAPDSRITLEALALSNRASEAEFHDDASGNNSLAPIDPTQRTVTYTVQTTTLDAHAAKLGIEHIDLLKIDVEGYDLHVLEGASELLNAQAIDLFVFEYNTPWVLSRRYLRDAWQYVNSKPYRLFRLYNGFLSPFEYDAAFERFDMTAMYVGISQQRLARGDIRLRKFPN